MPAGTAAGSIPGLHPTDLQSAYALPSASAGSGQKIGIVVAYDDPSIESDLGVYRAKFGLPPCTTNNGCFTKVGLGLLGSLLGGSQGWGQEAGWRTYDGTSVSAPIVAGAIALAGNGKRVLLDAAHIYANAAALNSVGGGYSAQAGNGSPNGIGAL